MQSPSMLLLYLFIFIVAIAWNYFTLGIKGVIGYLVSVVIVSAIYYFILKR